MFHPVQKCDIVALRNEKGSYNSLISLDWIVKIVALRNEKGSYNPMEITRTPAAIVALRNEKGSYNVALLLKV